MIDEVAFFMRDADEDIYRHAQREQEMTIRHVRRCPKSDQESRIDRMPDPAIEERSAKLLRWRFNAPAVTPGLGDPEQFEMTDQPGGDEQDRPAHQKDPPDCDPDRFGGY